MCFIPAFENPAKGHNHIQRFPQYQLTAAREQTLAGGS